MLRSFGGLCREHRSQGSGHALSKPVVTPVLFRTSVLEFRISAKARASSVLDQSPIYRREDIRICSRREENTRVKATNNLDAFHARRDGMYEPGAISRQQTTDSDTDGRHPRAIRNELSECNRTGAFARGHTARYPGTDSAGRRTGSVHCRRCWLRSTESLSGFMSDGGRQLHGARRSHAVSETS
jgi:hypothetical protein